MGDPGRMLMLVRVGWGAAMFARPNDASRLFRAPAQPYLTRAFAAREALLGLGYLSAGSTAERRRWLLAAIGGDAADGIGALLGWSSRELSGWTAAAFVGSAASWAALNAFALSRLGQH